MDTVALRILESVGPMAMVLIVVLAGILFNNSKLDKLESRLDARISSSESKLDARITSLEGRLDARITSLEGRLDARITSLEGRMNAGFDRMQADMAQFYRICSWRNSRYPSARS
jgi:hypothetical protein